MAIPFRSWAPRSNLFAFFLPLTLLAFVCYALVIHPDEMSTRFGDPTRWISRKMDAETFLRTFTPSMKGTMEIYTLSRKIAAWNELKEKYAIELPDLEPVIRKEMIQTAKRIGLIDSSRVEDSASISEESLITTIGRFLDDVSLEAIVTEAKDSSFIIRFLGLFSFINFLYTVGVILLIIALRNFFRMFLIGLLQSFQLIWKIIVHIPLEFYEILAYTCTSLGILSANGVRDEDVAFYIAILVGFLVPAAYFFSMYIHLHSEDGRKDIFGQISCWFHVIVWSMFAHRFQSTLFGFMVAIVYIMAFGFTFYQFCGGLSIGFTSEVSRKVSTLAAGAATVTFLISRISGFSSRHLNLVHPFELGFCFLGTFVHLLSLVIGSAKWVSNDEEYVLRQVEMLFTSLVYLLAGFLLHINCIIGIAGFWFCIWLGEKFLEIPASYEIKATFGIGGIAIALIASGIFLRANPHLLYMLLEL